MVKQVWSFNAESLYGVVKLDGIKHIVSQVQLKSSLVFCVIMASTGYGPSRGWPYFDGDESKYELWEVKFLGHMRLQKLHETVLLVSEGGREIPEVDKNAEAYAEIVQCLDDRSLALVFRDAKNDGRRHWRY